MPPKGTTSNGQEKRVVYKDVTVYKAQGQKALTQDQISRILGWEEVKPGRPYHIRDNDGKYVFLHRNTKNRPIYKGLLQTYTQEHLRGRWQFNGETTIVGKYASLLQGQHSLISCKLAEQVRRKNPEKYKDVWPGEITMERIVVYGIEEDDDVVNTIDTGKPRRMNDVLYRSEWFKDQPPAARKLLSRIAAYAIAFVWNRSGVDVWAEGYDPPRRTHPETVDFVRRHPKILECAAFINDAFGVGKKWEGNVAIFTPGYAAGALYLMGCSSSDGQLYRNGDRVEQDLEWDNWHKAKDFWVSFANSDPDMKILRATLEKLNHRDIDGRSPKVLEKVSTVAKAWHLFANDKPITTPGIKLSYANGVNGTHPHLKDVPEFGGIDDMEGRRKANAAINAPGKKIGRPKATDKAAKEEETHEQEEDTTTSKEAALEGTEETADSPEDSPEAQEAGYTSDEADQEEGTEEDTQSRADLDSIEQEKQEKRASDEKVKQNARKMASKTKRRAIPKTPPKAKKEDKNGVEKKPAKKESKAKEKKKTEKKAKK